METLFAAVILAHSWYPQNCCSEMDCKPVPCEELEQIEKGWKYLPRGTTFEPAQVHPSQDRYCHVCIHGDTGYCVFIQNVG